MRITSFFTGAARSSYQGWLASLQRMASNTTARPTYSRPPPYAVAPTWAPLPTTPLLNHRVMPATHISGLYGGFPIIRHFGPAGAFETRSPSQRNVNFSETSYVNLRRPFPRRTPPTIGFQGFQRVDPLRRGQQMFLNPYRVLSTSSSPPKPQTLVILKDPAPKTVSSQDTEALNCKASANNVDTTEPAHKLSMKPTVLAKDAPPPSGLPNAFAALEHIHAVHISPLQPLNTSPPRRLSQNSSEPGEGGPVGFSSSEEPTLFGIPRRRINDAIRLGLALAILYGLYEGVLMLWGKLKQGAKKLGSLRSSEHPAYKTIIDEARKNQDSDLPQANSTRDARERKEKSTDRNHQDIMHSVPLRGNESIDIGPRQIPLPVVDTPRTSPTPAALTASINKASKALTPSNDQLRILKRFEAHNIEDGSKQEYDEDKNNFKSVEDNSKKDHTAPSDKTGPELSAERKPMDSALELDTPQIESRKHVKNPNAENEESRKVDGGTKPNSLFHINPSTDAMAKLLPLGTQEPPATPQKPVTDNTKSSNSKFVYHEPPDPIDSYTGRNNDASKEGGRRRGIGEAYVEWLVDKIREEEAERAEAETRASSDTEEVPVQEDPSARHAKAVGILLELLGSEKVEQSVEARSEHEKSPFSHHEGTMPLAIVYPDSTEDVSTLLKVCNSHRVPVVPYGCGTSLEGHVVSKMPAILCDMSRMDAIIEIRPEDADVTVQAGTQWMTLNEALEKTGYFFPMDPGPGAAIGGMIGTCCSGTNAVRYGVMRDWVLKIKVVLADGRVTEIGNRARKDTAGYDLVRLFVGSEGTLGIVTEATLKLAVKPEHEVVAVCQFPSTENACMAVTKIIRRGTLVSAAEFLDPVCMKIVNRDSQHHFAEKPTIFFKFSGSPGQLRDTQEVARSVCQAMGGDKFQCFSSDENSDELHNLWNARKNLYYSIVDYAGESRESWITDVCVPLSRLPHLIQETANTINGSPLEAPVFGHVGDGNFHASILFNPKNSDDVKHAKAINDFIIDHALQAEGTCTGEHGVGLGKKAYLDRQNSPTTMELMRGIKRFLDPSNILNPGKVVDP